MNWDARSPSLTEARSSAERIADVAEALRTLDEAVPGAPEDMRERVQATRAHLAERKLSLDRIEAAVGQARTLEPEIIYLSSEEVRATAETALAEQAALVHRRNEAEPSWATGRLSARTARPQLIQVRT